MSMQKPLQYCKVISLQLIKINGKKTKTKILWMTFNKIVKPKLVNTEVPGTL